MNPPQISGYLAAERRRAIAEGAGRTTRRAWRIVLARRRSARGRQRVEAHPAPTVDTAVE